MNKDPYPKETRTPSLLKLYPMKCQVTYTWGALVAREMFGLKVTMVPGYEVVQGPEEEPAPEEAEGE